MLFNQRLAKLLNRQQKVQNTKDEYFNAAINHLWELLNSDQIFRSILNELEHSPEKEDIQIEMQEKILFPETEFKNAINAYLQIKQAVERINKGLFSPSNRFHVKRCVFDLYIFVAEKIGDVDFALGLIERYKHKCEWFPVQRKKLHGIYTSDTKRGEKNLAYHLYEFLYDQGLDFKIEPRSASGRPDLVSAQSEGQRLIADTKIFNCDKKYIAKGIRQVYDYASQYSQQFGYLVIYKVCEKDLSFNLSGKTRSAIPFLEHNNKTIFVITIDIHEYAQTPSKRGTLKSIEIDKDYVVEIINSDDD
ncbi:hypothetical protein Pse7367_0582 [Thalassoporum mexicanum PCC 7367]|uniref:hypothetical protein n=1 Tax=Thalassoporum mexicanum TaxID=3457544 RepID=UPI00029FD84D|nr:hypothetical protein [Pseudanabaena sp. PCC 7367]AFY68886.1 hypothetical protein Pse7367_0582 [Pseudanabaena sp. PCC 7367]